MKNKYVKLLTATALTSVLASGAALAQIKISGYHESNMITGSSTGANSTKQLGSETSLRFTANGNLNNGMTYLADYEMRNAVTFERLLNIGVTKDLDVYLGAESVKGAEIARTINPYVNNRIQDITNGTGLSNMVDGTSGENYIGFDFKNIVGNGRLSVTYTPNSSGLGAGVTGDTAANSITSTDLAGSTANATTTDAALSIITAGFVIDPIPSVKIGFGITKGDSKIATNDDLEGKTAGIRFTQGPASIGYQYHVNESNTANTTSQENKVNTFSATYAVNKELSVGLAHSKQERNVETAGVNAKQPDLKVKALQVGYNLGAAVIQYDYQDADNNGHVVNNETKTHKIKAKVNF
jgi:hypothetical protein